MKKMKLYIAFLISLLVSLPATADQTGSSAPPFVLNDSAGNSVSSGQYQGKVLLVCFWAPWCIPCRDELSAFDRLYAKHRQEGLEILAISVESSYQSVSGFLRKTRVTYPLLLDTNKSVSDAYRCSHLPTTVIIDRRGIIRKVVKGFSADFIQLYEQTITDLLKQPIP